MKTSITKARNSAVELTNDLLGAHSKAIETNPMAEIILLDLLKQTFEIKNKLKIMESFS